MKIGIVTFHFVNNFGGLLQTYALQKSIARECAATVEIIDYRNWFIRFTDTVRLFPVSIHPCEIKSGLFTMKKRLGRIKKFKKFMADNFYFSQYYGNALSIKAHPPKCDKYVCGSDQIWNPYITFGVDYFYFLGFVKNKDDKISYAPSFGTTDIGDHFSKKMKKYLVDFKSISVRELNGVNFVKKLTRKDAIQLIDPTFLLSEDDYTQIAVNPQIGEKYILLYIMQQDKEMYTYARKIKERLGLKIVEISRYGYKPDFIDISLVDVGPSEFIGLFQNAEYICTNSYHGFVFSILFKKTFCLIPCKRFRVRIENLGKLLGIDLPNMTVTDDPKDTWYDIENVQKRIAVEKQKAFRYLKGNLLGEFE